MIRQVKNDLLYDSAVSQLSRNGPSLKALSEEISIRGTAGPYTVIGSNFAPGTTAADIESAMIPSGGEMQSCRILTSTPTVIAEMVFSEKSNAESVISTFNNKKVGLNSLLKFTYPLTKNQADGRILHIYMKQGGPTPGPNIGSVRKPPIEPKENRLTETRKELPSPYDVEREQSDRRRRAEPEYQDGRFGFEAKEDKMDVDTQTAEPEVIRIDPPITNSVRTDKREERDRDRDRDRRDDRRDGRYDGPRDGGRGRTYYDRNRDGPRPRSDYRLHSDNIYSRPRGRGFR